MKVKLCGIRRPEDVAYLNEFRPDYAGFVFAGTRRRVTPETAAALAEKLDAGIRKAGVFVDEPAESIARTVRLAGLDAVQLHGNESAETVAKLRRLLPGVELWKAVRVRDRNSIPRALELGADRLVLDSFSASAYGGTGKTADWSLIREANPPVPYFLAGGLNSGNVALAVAELSPYGVDVSSGIETGGVKDRRKIEQIMRILRKVGS
jgi:phosphoribosylanthranilate isomerase